MANADILNFLQELQRSFLECGVCAEVYNEDDHIPRQLPCFHSFCSACLRRLGKRGNEIECSLCKTVHKIKQGSTVNFYKDNTRRDLLTFLNKNANGNGLAMCSECNEILKLWFTCNSCSIILCPGCKEMHSKQYSRHRIDNPPISTELDAEYVEKCELSGHDNGPLKYICMSSLCQVALCSTCVVEFHRDDAFHELKELKTHVQERKDSLLIDLKSLKDKIVIANSFIMKSKANFDHYRTEKEVLKRKIDKLKEMGSRDSTCTYLNNQLTEICGEQEQLRVIVMRNLTNFMTNAEKCRSECKHLLDEKSTRTFLLVEKTKKEEIDGLLTHELNIFDDKKALQCINDLLTNEYKILEAQKALQSINQTESKLGQYAHKQNKRKANRDREQTARKGYNNRHPTCTPWKKRICLVMSVVVILIFDYIIGNLPADRVFENIKLMTYQFDTSKPSHFACSSLDNKIVSTLPVDFVDTCGSGNNFMFQGVFGNKSFGKDEEAKFNITLQFPVKQYNFDFNGGYLLFEFGFTLNTSIKDHLYQKEHVWAVSVYRCQQRYGVCLVLTYSNQSQVYSVREGDVKFTEDVQSITAIASIAIVLNRRTMTMSLFTASKTLNIKLGKGTSLQANDTVWPVFALREHGDHNVSFPLSATINKDSGFSFDPSSLQHNLFLSEDYNSVSNRESPNIKFVNKKTRYISTISENFQPNMKDTYSRFRISVDIFQVVKVGKKLFDFGFGIVKNREILPIIKIGCKMCLTNAVKTPEYCLQNVLDNATMPTVLTRVDHEWDIFVHFQFSANKLNIFILPCDVCSYYYQSVVLNATCYEKPHRFFVGQYNMKSLIVISNATVTVSNVISMRAYYVFKYVIVFCFLVFVVLKLLSAIFQLYHGDQL